MAPLRTSLALFALALTMPVHAQEASVTAIDPGNGVRETVRVGFTLLEHGIWSAAQPAAPWPGISFRALGRRAASPGRRSVYLPWVSMAEAQYAIPAGLLDALIWTESRYDPFAISAVGAAGLAQLMPATANDVGVVNRYDARANIEGGARYLRRMLDRFGSVHLALAAYNAGPRAVERSGGIPINRETPTYVARVMRRWTLSNSASD